MDGLPSQLPDDPAALKALLQQQQRTIEQQRKDLDRKQQFFVYSQKKLNASEQRLERFREKVIRKQDYIERLEERLRRLLAHRFGQRSEKNPDQFQLFNEAELLAEHAADTVGDCNDGRLPISNIQSEHVAKTIAIARKNFLFADTAAGAESSGRIFSLIETARANGHHPQRYLSVLLTELPNVNDADQVEAYFPGILHPLWLLSDTRRTRHRSSQHTTASLPSLYRTDRLRSD